MLTKVMAGVLGLACLGALTAGISERDPLLAVAGLVGIAVTLIFLLDTGHDKA